MFCCRPRLAGDEDAEARTGNANVQSKTNYGKAEDIQIKSNKKKHVPIANEKYQQSDKNTRVPPRLKVDHVVSINDNVYVKLSDMRQNQVRKTESQTVFYNGREPHYMTLPTAPKSNVNISRSVSYHCNNMAIPRAKLSIQRSNTYRESYPPAIQRVSTEYTRSEYVPALPPRNNSVGNSFDDKQSSRFAYVIEKNKDSEDKCDTDSYSEEQKFALDQLDSTLNEYNTNEFDSPVIVTDILPYGVFEVDEKFDSGLESDVTPSSRTSSLSSNKSRNSINGIISTSKSKRDRRVTSVSFKLPPDHVDKPYAPMQSNRPKSAPVPVIPTTIAVTDYKSKVWSTNASTVLVEDRSVRRLSGPFKGSFKKLFYGKYAPKDIVGNDEGKMHVSPRLMERVNSFETLTDTKLTGGKGKAWIAHTRTTVR